MNECPSTVRGWRGLQSELEASLSYTVDLALRQNEAKPKDKSEEMVHLWFVLLENRHGENEHWMLNWREGPQQRLLTVKEPDRSQRERTHCCWTSVHHANNWVQELRKGCTGLCLRWEGEGSLKVIHKAIVIGRTVSRGTGMKRWGVTREDRTSVLNEEEEWNS